MTKGRYTLKGKTYKMDIHGFVKDMMFKAKKVSETHIIFTIMYTEETYQQYPYKFSCAKKRM